MPRAKTAKRYRKLMERYSMTFGFREPYQIVVDATLLADACRFKMDLIKSFEQTLSGKVKPLITQCSMRHLYGTKSEPGVNAAIELGKTFERRRCGHHPDQYPEPLSTLECLSSVVDPKDNGVNKHRYVVASNDQPTRQALRAVKGTPLVYISRSVMIMEPMADESVQVRNREEKAKLRSEIKRFAEGSKRKRGEDSDSEADETKSTKKPQQGEAGAATTTADGEEKKKKKKKGPKGPNPLAVMKKKTTTKDAPSKKSTDEAPAEGEPKEGPKRKRRKKAKAETEAGGAEGTSTAQPEGDESD